MMTIKQTRDLKKQDEIAKDVSLARSMLSLRRELAEEEEEKEAARKRRFSNYSGVNTSGVTFIP